MTNGTHDSSSLVLRYRGVAGVKSATVYVQSAPVCADSPPAFAKGTYEPFRENLMKVLFIPHTSALSHIIPLLALDRMLAGSRIETAFLAPQRVHALLKNVGANALPDNHNGFMTGVRTEVLAYRKFAPDVVVDDTSVSTGFATALTGVPRITIQRTGMFPGGLPGNSAHRHSINLISSDVKDFPDPTLLGLPPLKTPLDLFKANVKIVPGVPSVELLPPQLRDDPTYHFAGPLIMGDFLVGQLGRPDGQEADMSSFSDFESLRNFFNANEGRKIAYVTFGTVAVATPPVFECIRHLLGKGVAVVTSIRNDKLAGEFPDTYFFAPYLPMHFVCTHADLMVHQCGSGTYHYPIIHNVPTITIGTQCYDREDVARRLERLGVSVHLPSPDETANFVADFKEVVNQYFDDDGAFIRAKKEKLLSLNAEIESVSRSFNFEAVVREAASLRKPKVGERPTARYTRPVPVAT
jgi:UDP:flavonoid glycosyltransferase YjiC (YdhE family)